MCCQVCFWGRTCAACCSGILRELVVFEGPERYASARPLTLVSLQADKFFRQSKMSSRQARSVKAGASAEDARNQRMRNTVELRKQKTDDKMKRLRNLEMPSGDTLGASGMEGGSSVSCFLASTLSYTLPFSLGKSFLLPSSEQSHARAGGCGAPSRDHAGALRPQ